jgi:single-stranded-DNA-specific exonuclease
LGPKLKQLADPFLLPHMEQAVDRLYFARTRSEQVVLFGDYDVDGVTSTTLLLEVLRGLGWKVNCYLPHRMDEGYGLQEAVENCLRRNPATLLVAVDCGSTANGTVELLRARGIDVIVLDHHQVSNPPPGATALVNPHLQCSSFSLGFSSGSASGGLERDTQVPVAPPIRRADLPSSAPWALRSLAHALLKRGRQLGLRAAFDFDLRQPRFGRAGNNR